MEYILYVWLYTAKSHLPTKYSYQTSSLEECNFVANTMKREKFVRLDNGKKLKFNEIHTECMEVK